MKEVSFYTTQNDAAVTVTIRKYSTTHPDTNIDSGTLIEQSKDIIIPLAGYHTYKLADPATLNKGEYFSVILALQILHMNFLSLQKQELTDILIMP